MTSLETDGFDGHNLLGTHPLSPNSLDTRAGQCETPDRGTLLSSTVGPPQEPVSGPHPPGLLRPCVVHVMAFQGQRFLTSDLSSGLKNPVPLCPARSMRLGVA